MAEVIDPEPLPLPCCRFCGKEIALPALYNWQAPEAMQIIFTVYCPNIECRKILHMQIMLVQPPTIEATPSRVHRPS